MASSGPHHDLCVVEKGQLLCGCNLPVVFNECSACLPGTSHNSITSVLSIQLC